nr:ATP-dependent DNA helicase PIF1-like [Tanacetum cinerariifolium]
MDIKTPERAPLGILEDRRVDLSSSPVNNSELIDVTASDSHTLTKPGDSVLANKENIPHAKMRFFTACILKNLQRLHKMVHVMSLSLADLGPLDNYKVTLNASVELDQRNYNLPTTSEVAGIWVEGNNNTTAYKRSIVVYGRFNYPTQIQPHFASYDPLSYVLFFPNSEPGWHSKIPRDGESIDEIIRDEENIDEDSEEPNETGGRKTVTMWEYYCYKFQIRSTPNRNQSKIRADLYQGIVDCVNAVQDDKKPDILLTMTCNPNWPEIQTKLLPGQDAPDRPDLVSRVFRAKLEDLKEQLFKSHVLGVVCSHVYVIEFQKRGLPHAHFLLIMRAYNKMSNPDQYDKIVCSEIPDLTRHPVMHELVKKHMMHGPCGSLRTSSPLKYVFKYVYKGHDKQVVRIDPKSENVVINEIKRFQDARYVCPLRKRGSMKGIMVSANPAEGERFYLRLLMSHVCGPTDWKDLYTVNNVLYQTFQRSALERGLIENNDALSTCLGEGSLFQFPPALRRRLYENVEVAQNIVLKDIQVSLRSMSKDLDDFDLPKLNMDSDVYDEILRHVDNDIMGVFFIDGPGGTGKTFLYKALLANVRSCGFIALETASSGAAANNMSGGRTAHSRFKIQINLENNSFCNIKKQSGIAKLLRAAKLIIWDEASMAKRHGVEALDRSMQDIMGMRLPFGGKIMVLGGDFRQVFSVVRRETLAQIVDSSLRMSPLWSVMKKMRLTLSMRARTDPCISDFLLRVKKRDEQAVDENYIRILDDMTIPYNDMARSKEELSNAIFPSLHINGNSSDYIISRAIS